MDLSSITGPLWDMIKCLCGYADQKAAYVFDLEENLQLLKEKWDKLQEKKKDLEAYLEVEENTGEMQRSHQVSDWLERMVSVQQEINDILERGSKEIKKKCLSKYCISSYKLGKDVAEILRKVEELEKEGADLCKGINITYKRLHKWNEMPCGETVGLDLMIGKVLESIEEENVGIVGLYGMGGVGKTTLLRKINNELGKKTGFYIVLVVVSKSPNLLSIMECIRKCVGIGDDIWNCSSDQYGKAAKIYEVLKRNKFVLLLDDIWDRLDLNMVGVPRPEETNFQSKVLFTTRSKDVCSNMNAQRLFKVEVLSEEEAFELFCMNVGKETLNSNPRILKIAEEMAKACKQLPLALTVIGRAMAGMETVESWEHSKINFLNSRWTDLNWEKDVFSILEFSYDRLPTVTHKKCFLYCALYPEDDKIHVYSLIEKWIGEGFFDVDGMRSVHDMRCHGGFIIKKLKHSCLLENVEDDMFEPLVKMHDVIRDMALWIAHDRDTNKKKVIVQEDAGAISQANVENWKMVERISILNNVESWLQSKSWTSLETLLLHFKFNCAINGLQNIQYASQLKVLELWYADIVSAEGIGGLNLLQYLSLVVPKLTNASKLWRELENLKNLKVFHLFVRGDNALPLQLIPNLPELKVFKFYVKGVRDGRDEELFVGQLEKSSNLEELWMDITTESGLNKLLKSAKLPSCIYGLYLYAVHGQVNGPLLLATMSKMKHLQQLQLHELKNVIDLPVCDTCRLSTLQNVSIDECDTIHHLTWLKYAPLLQRLDVRYCCSIEEVIKGEIILEDERDTIFPSLEELSLHRLPNLRSIHERVLSFPSLRSINVSAMLLKREIKSGGTTWSGMTLPPKPLSTQNFNSRHLLQHYFFSEIYLWKICYIWDGLSFHGYFLNGLVSGDDGCGYFRAPLDTAGVQSDIIAGFSFHNLVC
ncbi:hypothetical protein K1719_036428 [Acacia pycnantha]|nr:hypothetical protein K1719_036428 [Acacia pycnantha]